MNRNYLPPSLKLSQGSGSPPSASNFQPPQSPVLAQSASPQQMLQMRRFGRACKLPTVQEVGKLKEHFMVKDLMVAC